MNSKMNSKTLSKAYLSIHWLPPQGSKEESIASQPYDLLVDVCENLDDLLVHPFYADNSRSVASIGSVLDAFSAVSICSVVCHLDLPPPRAIAPAALCTLTKEGASPPCLYGCTPLCTLTLTALRSVNNVHKEYAMESNDALFREVCGGGYLRVCPQQKMLCKCGIAACWNKMTWYESIGMALMVDRGPREKTFLVTCFLCMCHAEERMEEYRNQLVWHVDGPLAYFLQLAKNTFAKLTPEWAGYPLS